MSDTTKALEDLKATHAKMAEEIKALETKITEEAEAKRPELALGQLWRHERGSVYMATHTQRSGLGIDLMCCANSPTSQHTVGRFWDIGCGFGRGQDKFTYLGMASDLLTIKEPNK